MRGGWIVGVLVGMTMASGLPVWAGAIYLSGRVRTAETQTPVGGATVSLYNQTEPDAIAITQTLMNGSFILKAPAPGAYRLAVTGGGCLPYQQPIDVGARGIPTLDLEVQPEPMLHLKLIGPDGEPVTRGSVEVSGWLTGTSLRGWGQATIPFAPESSPAPGDGKMELPAPAEMPPDAVQEVVISVRDAEVGCGQTHVEEWPQEPVLVTLARGTIINGTVVDAGQKPVAGATVTAIRVSQRGRFAGGFRAGVTDPRAISDQDGKFEIPALFNGGYLLRATLPDGTVHAQAVNVTGTRTVVTLSPDNPGDRALPGWLQQNQMPFFRRRALPFGAPNYGPRQRQMPRGVPPDLYFFLPEINRQGKPFPPQGPDGEPGHLIPQDPWLRDWTTPPQRPQFQRNLPGAELPGIMKSLVDWFVGGEDDCLWRIGF